MEKKIKFVIGCNIVAAACFGIVSYGDFYRGRFERGCLFAVLSILQFGMAVKNYISYVKNK